MRDLCKIIDAIIKEIPTWYSHDYALCCNLLEDRKESVMYTAPESMGYRWQEVGTILRTHIGKPDADWKRKIQDIFEDKIQI